MLQRNRIGFSLSAISILHLAILPDYQPTVLPSLVIHLIFHAHTYLSWTSFRIASKIATSNLEYNMIKLQTESNKSYEKDACFRHAVELEDIKVDMLNVNGSAYNVSNSILDDQQCRCEN